SLLVAKPRDRTAMVAPDQAVVRLTPEGVQFAILGAAVPVSLPGRLHKKLLGLDADTCHMRGTPIPFVACRSASDPELVAFSPIGASLAKRLSEQSGLEVTILAGGQVVASTWERGPSLNIPAEVTTGIAAGMRTMRPSYRPSKAEANPEVETFDAWTRAETNADLWIGLSLAADSVLARPLWVIGFSVAFGLLMLALAVIWTIRFTARIVDPVGATAVAVEAAAHSLAGRNAELAASAGLPTSVANPRPDSAAPSELEAMYAALARLTEELANTDAIDHQIRAVRVRLMDATVAAAAGTEAKARFLANMSHELRTPLTLILGYAEMAIDDLVADSEARSDVEEIVRSGKQLFELINQILDLADAESGELELSLERVDVAALMQQVAETMKVDVLLSGNEFVVECPESIGMMTSDSLKLEQVLRNLLSNAAKFTHDGEVELSVCRSTTDGQPWLSFSVADTGIGLSDEQQQAIFAPFSQVDGSATRVADGSGIGLTVCRNIAHAMGGELTVTSRPGAGSLFTVRVPRNGQNKATALLIESDEGARASMALGIRNAGWSLRDVKTPDEALTTLMDHRSPSPGLILMGLRIGEDEFSEFVEQVHQELQLDVPVVAIRPTGLHLKPRTDGNTCTAIVEIVEQRDLEHGPTPARLLGLVAHVGT
ncbi:MAG: signal transduction histidine kinase, partial [Myxococcota bacterium]